MGRQLSLELRRWGGYRPGAGRKPRGERLGVTHRRRAELARRFPVHVTVRMRPEVYNLRSRRCFRVIRAAFAAQNGRFGFRLNQFSVQGNHVHLIVEADGKQSLSRGMQGLSIRIAKALNRVMQRTGTVLADRYHAHILRTPNEVRRALDYVLDNARRHFGLPAPIDRYSSEAADATGAAPRTWLLRAAIEARSRFE
jgi:REP element-mobilizing transposase RayT